MQRQIRHKIFSFPAAVPRMLNWISDRLFSPKTKTIATPTPELKQVLVYKRIPFIVSTLAGFPESFPRVLANEIWTYLVPLPFGIPLDHQSALELYDAMEVYVNWARKP